MEVDGPQQGAPARSRGSAAEGDRSLPSHLEVRTFEARPVVVSGVRAWMREFVGRSPAGGNVVDVAVLLISELATNAIRHGGGSHFTVSLEITDRLTASVQDRSVARLPRLRHPGPDEIAGRGLELVQALSSDWGYSRHPRGKSVWFQLSLTPGA